MSRAALLLFPFLIAAQAHAGPRGRNPTQIINESQAATQQIDQQLKQPNLPPAQREELTEKRAEQIQNIETAADSEPKNVGVQARAMGAFMQVNEPNRALPRADNVVALAPQNPQSYVLRGQVKQRLGDYGGAEDDAKRALDIDPNNQAAQQLFALTHGRGGRRAASAPQQNGGGQAQAEAPARRTAAAPQQERPALVKTAPAPVAATPAAIVSGGVSQADRLKAFDLFKQAQSKSALGDEDAAKALLDKAVAADKANPAVLAARAQSRAKTGDPRGALEDANAALTLDGRNGRAYLARAMAREALGETPDAVLGDYKLAAELDPDLGPELEKALARRAPATKGQDGAQAPAENLTSGKLPPAAKKLLPWALVGLGLLVFAGGALWLKRGGGDGAPPAEPS